MDRLEMDRTRYTRESAARMLLHYVRGLTHEAYVHTPNKMIFTEELVTIRSDLEHLGYSNDGTVLRSVSAVISSIERNPGLHYIPFSPAIDLAQHLLRAVQALSNSSFPFPSPNPHPPPEILHLIYDHVRELSPSKREAVVNALSLTSQTWRRIVLERPIVYLNTLEKVEEYKRGRRCSKHLKHARYWEEMNIDLLKEEELDWNFWQEVFPALDEIVGSRRRGRARITLNSEGDAPLGDVWMSGRVGWGPDVREFMESWEVFDLCIPRLDEEDYSELWQVLDYKAPKDGQERGYRIGTWKEPVNLESEASQMILEGVDRLEEQCGDPSNTLVKGPPSCPIFTSYTTFAVPWLVFTTPIFLLETAPERYRPISLPPSRLLHLELSFEVDPSRPAQAIQHLESFFSAISPKIERLAFRLRATSPHPSEDAEAKFSRKLVSCLASCRRLRHLEIGGFGTAPSFLPQLSILPLSVLVLLPLQHVTSFQGHVLPLFTTPSPLRESLVTLRLERSLLAQGTVIELLRFLDRKYVQIRFFNGHPERHHYTNLMISLELDDRTMEVEGVHD